jgi:CBS domain-containing protein
VLTIGPEATVFEALARMAEGNVGALIVVDVDRVEGVISERDYARKVILSGKASRDTAVREIMSAPAITVGLDTSVAECMRLMTENHVRHLPVIELWELVGCVSIGDVVKTIIAEQERRLAEYAAYVSGSYPG